MNASYIVVVLVLLVIAVVWAYQRGFFSKFKKASASTSHVLVETSVLKDLAGIHADEILTEEDLLNQVKEEYLLGKVLLKEMTPVDSGMEIFATKHKAKTLREMHRALARETVLHYRTAQENANKNTRIEQNAAVEEKSYDALVKSHNALVAKLTDQLDRQVQLNQEQIDKENLLVATFTKMMADKEKVFRDMLQAVTAHYTVYRYDDEASANKVTELMQMVADCEQMLKDLQKKHEEQMTEIRNTAKTEVEAERKAANDTRKEVTASLVEALKTSVAQNKGGRR